MEQHRRLQTMGDSGFSAEVGLSSFEVCAEVGVTYRILDYWARIGVLRPTIRDSQGPGSARRYSLADVKVAMILNVLRQMGATGDVLAAVATAVRAEDLSGGCLFVSPFGEVTKDPTVAHAAWACWWVINLDPVSRSMAGEDAAEMAG